MKDEDHEEDEEEEEEEERNNNRRLGGWEGDWEGHTPGGRLAFSVENILAPGRFCKQDEEQDSLGNIRTV